MNRQKEWAKFLDQIESNRKALSFGPGEETFFRGQGDASWSLAPSLFRGPVVRSRYEYQKLEYDLFFEFEARAHEIHDRSFTQWDILFNMRHHGVPTRLLDWTESLGVAVFFAIQNFKPGRKPCVWMLNPYSLNEHEDSYDNRDLISPDYLGNDYGQFLIEDEGFGFKLPVAIYPKQRNPRMGAQKGWFTCHGDLYKPLEKIIGSSVLRKVELDVAAIPAAQAFLDSVCLDDYQVFPDLDGLARALSKKYGFISPMDVLGASALASTKGGRTKRKLDRRK